MEILGIGPLELLTIIIIALLVLGPKDMVKVMGTLGRWMRSVVTSDWWRAFQKGLRELRKMPYEMMRQAALEEQPPPNLPSREAMRRAVPGGQPGAADQTDYAAWIQPAAPAAAGDSQEAPEKILPPGIDLHKPAPAPAQPGAAPEAPPPGGAG
jgi:sec-independent protein translocase protein TatB